MAAAWLLQVPYTTHTLSCYAANISSECTQHMPCVLLSCSHQVFRHHHEALEHLLHLTYYAMGLQPPRLVKRVYSSAAAGVGAAKWKQAFRAADELPSNLQALAMGDAGLPLLQEGSEAAA